MEISISTVSTYVPQERSFTLHLHFTTSSLSIQTINFPVILDINCLSALWTVQSDAKSTGNGVVVPSVKFSDDRRVGWLTAGVMWERIAEKDIDGILKKDTYYTYLLTYILLSQLHTGLNTGCGKMILNCIGLWLFSSKCNSISIPKPAWSTVHRVLCGYGMVGVPVTIIVSHVSLKLNQQHFFGGTGWKPIMMMDSGLINTDTTNVLLHSVPFVVVSALPYCICCCGVFLTWMLAGDVVVCVILLFLL